MTRQRTLKDIPDDQLDQVVADFRSDGAIRIETLRQADGRWTVTAEFG